MFPHEYMYYVHVLCPVTICVLVAFERDPDCVTLSLGWFSLDFHSQTSVICSIITLCSSMLSALRTSELVV